MAELGAAFLCVFLQVTPELRPEHASYIEHWLKMLRGDNRAIFAAAAHAQRAAHFLLAFTPPNGGVSASPFLPSLALAAPHFLRASTSPLPWVLTLASAFLPLLRVLAVTRRSSWWCSSFFRPK